MAAVLAYAERTVLSHWSAADHLGLYWSARSVIDVMTPHRSGRSRPGLLVHRPRTLAPGDATTADGIPCTTWARTALDLAAAAQPRVIERVIERAESLRIYDERALDALLERNPMHRGARTLRSVVDRLGDPVATKNALEEAFFRLCDNARIPRPLVNQWIHLDDGGNPVEADFMWPEHGVIVEVDGWATHGTRAAFERDREKDVRLELADWTVVRFTWREVTRNPARVARRVAGLLSRRRRLAA
ncbi:MAG: hypothetical protein QOH38_490 [Thermoleophilaceae bacterium]|nr:hypothetical protein [Thermoleophilaceae bacterium]